MNDLARKSLVANFNTFVATLTDVEVVEIGDYVGGNFSKTPSAHAQEFVKTFFSNERWALFVQEQLRPSQVFSRIGFQDIAEINGIRSLLFYEIMLRYQRALQGKPEKAPAAPKDPAFKRKLKKELAGALEESIVDGVFCKVEGFCNISDVLLKHNLITFPEEE